MARNATLTELRQLEVEDGRLSVAVSWEGAEALQSHLRRHGVDSTLHLDPMHREARLVLWNPADEAKARAALITRKA